MYLCHKDTSGTGHVNYRNISSSAPAETWIVMAKPLTVIVVGAGYAGIGAARELLEEGGNDVQVPDL